MFNCCCHGDLLGFFYPPKWLCVTLFNSINIFVHPCNIQVTTVLKWTTCASDLCPHPFKGFSILQRKSLLLRWTVDRHSRHCHVGHTVSPFPSHSFVSHWSNSNDSEYIIVFFSLVCHRFHLHLRNNVFSLKGTILSL